MRAIALIAFMLAGCGSDTNVAADQGAPPLDASVACSTDLAAGHGAPISCGPITCPAGKICMIFQPGTAPPPDAGNINTYSCENLPAGCACTAGCGAQPSASGCFSKLCQGEPSCRFDGTTLLCIGL